MEIKKTPEIENLSTSSVAYNRCLKCNREFSPRRNECPICGGKLKFESGLVKTYNYKICIHCESDIPPRFKECPNCGGKLLVKYGKPEKITSTAYNSCPKCKIRWSPRSQNCAICGSTLIFTDVYIQTYVTDVI
jgi:rRNA maturation endonuclease Nob1